MAANNCVAMEINPECNEAKCVWAVTASLFHRAACFRAYALCPSWPGHIAACSAHHVHSCTCWRKNIHFQTISCQTSTTSSLHLSFIAQANSQWTQKSGLWWLKLLYGCKICSSHSTRVSALPTPGRGVSSNLKIQDSCAQVLPAIFGFLSADMPLPDAKFGHKWFEGYYWVAQHEVLPLFGWVPGAQAVLHAEDRDQLWAQWAPRQLLAPVDLCACSH